MAGGLAFAMSPATLSSPPRGTGPAKGQGQPRREEEPMVQYPQPHVLTGSTVLTCWRQRPELSPGGFLHSKGPLELTLFFPPAFFPHVLNTYFPIGARGSARQDRATRERQTSCTGKGTPLPQDA